MATPAIAPIREQLWTLMHMSTKWLRFMLAVIALSWAVILAFPGDVMQRPAYHVMQALFSEDTWTAFYALYFVAVTWRMFFSRSIAASYIINMYGLLLFTTATISFAAANLQPTPPTLSSEIGLALMALWVFVRSPAEND